MKKASALSVTPSGQSLVAIIWAGLAAVRLADGARMLRLLSVALSACWVVVGVFTFRQRVRSNRPTQGLTGSGPDRSGLLDAKNRPRGSDPRPVLLHPRIG